MHRSDIARSEVGTFSIRWRVVLEQLDLVPGSPENGDRNLSAGHSRDFTGEVTGMMRPMRKLEPQDILPEGQRPLEVCDRDTGVIRGDDAEARGAHARNVVGRDKLQSIHRGSPQINTDETQMWKDSGFRNSGFRRSVLICVHLWPFQPRNPGALFSRYRDYFQIGRGRIDHAFLGLPLFVNGLRLRSRQDFLKTWVFTNRVPFPARSQIGEGDALIAVIDRERNGK